MCRQITLKNGLDVLETEGECAHHCMGYECDCITNSENKEECQRDLNLIGKFILFLYEAYLRQSLSKLEKKCLATPPNS